MREPNRRLSRATLRPLALLWPTLVLMAQVSSFAHLSLVKHGVCAQHGDFVHQDEMGQHTVRSPASGFGKVEQLFSADTVADTRHVHGHCALASHQRERRALRPVDYRVVPPTQLELVGLPRRVGTFPEQSIALLVLAPKSSPPA